MTNRSQYNRRWRTWRFVYYGGLGCFFAAIAFYFGPNVIMFRKLTWITPADFAKHVDQESIETVRAIKAYRNDHGTVPERIRDLEPAYLAKAPWGADMYDGELSVHTEFGHRLIYRFGPADEGWWVAGPFVRGRIPLPPVDAAPSTRRATREN